jgi:glycosyltransferase involved in cell wall biosynthesis
LKKLEEKLLVVNQNSGYLTIDIVNNLVSSYAEVVLLSGCFPVSSRELLSAIKFKKTKKYISKNIYSKFFSWLFCTVHLFLLILFKYRNYRILYFTNPPMSYFCSLIFRNRFSIVVFDLYPNALKLIGIQNNNIIYKIWKKINTRVFSKARNIYVLSDKMKDLIQEYVQKDRITTVELWSSSNEFKPIPKEENSFLSKYNLQGKFLVMYSGNLGMGHNLKVLVKLANEFKSYSDIHFLIIGDGIQKRQMIEMVDEMLLENITFLPFQDVKILPYSLAAADISVVTMNPDVANFSLPSKFFNAIAVGSPILAIGGKNSELEIILNRFKVGLYLSEENIDVLNKFILDLFLNPSRRIEFGLNAIQCSRYFNVENSKIITA